VTSAPAITIFIDADACPVKDETYKVAARYGLKTFVVSNSFMQIPASPLIERVVVDAGPDIADDWIAERAARGDIVITNDIPLADRVLKSGAAAMPTIAATWFPSASATNSISHPPMDEPIKIIGPGWACASTARTSSRQISIVPSSNAPSLSPQPE
jgi:hypothetical protein